MPEARLRACDPNPRGGTRGARGIAVGDGEILVANYDTIFRYDASWRLVGAISNPQCADIHDIAFCDGRLWVASTRNDRLFQFDLDGNVKDRFDPWDMGFVQDAFGIARGRSDAAGDLRDPRTHDKSQTDRLHLNSFAFADDGGLLVSLGQVRVNGHCESAIVRFGASGGADVVHHAAAAPVPAHNVIELPDGTIVHCDTANGQVIAIDPAPGNDVKTLLQTCGGYARGLCVLDDRRLAVGVQNEVWLFDPVNTGEVRRIRVSDDPRESVHSIVNV